MHLVLVAMLPLLIIALVVAIARITTVAIIVVAVLIALLVVRRPLFTAYLGVVPLPAVRAIVVVLFTTAFAIFIVLLIGRTVLFIGRVPSRLVEVGGGLA